MAGVNVYLTQDEEEILAPRTVGGEGARGDRSSVLQRIIGRYAETVRRSTPTLTVDEWKLLCDAMNGTLHESAVSIAAVWQEIEDTILLDAIDAKWGVEGPALVKKLKRLDYAGQVAVVDVVERYWTATRRGETAKVPGEGA